jgi:hypothetical protein
MISFFVSENRMSRSLSNSNPEYDHLFRILVFGKEFSGTYTQYVFSHKMEWMFHHHHSHFILFFWKRYREKVFDSSVQSKMCIWFNKGLLFVEEKNKISNAFCWCLFRTIFFWTSECRNSTIPSPKSFGFLQVKLNSKSYPSFHNLL